MMHGPIYIKLQLALFADVAATWRAFPKLTEIAWYIGTEKDSISSRVGMQIHIISQIYEGESKSKGSFKITR